LLNALVSDYWAPAHHAVEHEDAERPDRTFAQDEFGPLGIRPTAGSCWAERGRPARLPAMFRRTHGITYFHGCYSVRTIRTARPDGAPICVILDNLSARTNWRPGRPAARTRPRPQREGNPLGRQTPARSGMSKADRLARSLDTGGGCSQRVRRK
jgi:hypothetical protein